jgi:hypothetical protein
MGLTDYTSLANVYTNTPQSLIDGLYRDPSDPSKIYKMTNGTICYLTLLEYAGIGFGTIFGFKYNATLYPNPAHCQTGQVSYFMVILSGLGNLFVKDVVLYDANNNIVTLTEDMVYVRNNYYDNYKRNAIDGDINTQYAAVAMTYNYFGIKLPDLDIRKVSLRSYNGISVTLSLWTTVNGARTLKFTSTTTTNYPATIFSYSTTGLTSIAQQ